MPPSPPYSSLAPSRDGHVLRWQPDTPNGRDVVLLHGFLDAAGSWDLVAPTLAAAGFRVWALDLRGHGEGHRIDPDDYYHFPDYLLDLERLLALHPELSRPFVLVGHSMGGMVATLFAGTFPERVDHLVVIEGIGPPETDGETTPERMRGFVEGVRAIRDKPAAASLPRADLLRRLELAHPKLSTELLASRLPHLTEERADGTLVWRYDPLHRTRGPFPFRVSMFQRFAERVIAPVLYVTGGANGFRVTGENDRLASYRTLRRLDLDGAGHMIHWTRPTELARAIVEHAALPVDQPDQ